MPHNATNQILADFRGLGTFPIFSLLALKGPVSRTELLSVAFMPRYGGLPDEAVSISGHLAESNTANREPIGSPFFPCGSTVCSSKVP